MRYDLDELSQRTRFPVRTIRYYVTEGLLPKPAGVGPGAHYRDTHLLRLHYIRTMQRAEFGALTLAEIREQLRTFDDAQLLNELQTRGLDPFSLPRLEARSSDASPSDESNPAAEAETLLQGAPDRLPAAPPTPTAVPEAAGRSALAYIQQTLRSPSPTASPARGKHTEGKPSPPADLPHSPEAYRSPRAQGAFDHATWERIHLADGFELHVRRPQSHDGNRQLDELLRYARSVFRSP